MTKEIKKTSGLGAEPFYKSRRVWAAILSLLAVILTVWRPEYSGVAAPVFTAIAGFLGLSSWTWPK